MKKSLFMLSLASALALSANQNLELPLSQNLANQTLQGDQKSACEAILCLPASSRPSECKPSVKKYFSIIGKKPSDTANKRKQFLNKCPADNTPQMQAIKDAIVAGAFSKITNKYCEPSHLNSQPGVYKSCIIDDIECRQKKQITNNDFQEKGLTLGNRLAISLILTPKNPPTLPKECESEPLSYKCHAKGRGISCGWEVDE
ncbi:type IV conjugative transfer system protein TrbM [Candidatus Campylobacter infans]|uniref:Type IV conjugative transfer system protein TrbM n=1 Tax=Candidatus Campylobacter infans TaxID=2561898 RepID=A0A7H9CGQ5_9BACT|nr:TrbM/KikA/MpfK family conjugal transfer protein [Candidatus Campylobacter infans]KAF0590045.1 MAG: type IV conjugative transfer system protein TrbM [Candidatus Campylobacter infans]QLI05152.1 type IV conjugative transfer system protein TrbM [Candidatus Campylobacter infans]